MVAKPMVARKDISIRMRQLVAILVLTRMAGLHTTVSAAPTVSGLRLGESGSGTRFVIDIDSHVDAEVYTLDDPYRLVIDLPASDFATESQGRGDGKGLVAQYRYGRFDAGTSRVVLDLERPARLERSFTLKPQGPYSYRLVFDLVSTTKRNFAANIRKPSRVAAAPQGQSRVSPSPEVRLADSRKVVVIDAGHGGIDPGAPGANGHPEKAVTLAVAQRAAALLRASGRYDVVLTRTSDVFIDLRERVEIARRNKADLFISLHADSLDNRSVRGATVYTLSETASDKEAAALARRENRSNILAGLNLEYQPEVANILIDLAQRETMNFSARFANYLIPELQQRMTVRTNTHRFAGFVVLKAPDVPSVLVEMGFMSNSRDARFLSSSSGQQRIGESLVAAVDRYFRALETAQY